MTLPFFRRLTTRGLLPGCTLLLLLSLLTGCMMLHRVPTGFHAVWTPKDGKWPERSLTAPAGFKVTPYEAYEITRKGFHRSLKHRWHLYADASHYYVHDTFLGDSPQEAHKHGLRIDGRTGRVITKEGAVR